MNGQTKQMTEHETKRASWLFMHPRADGRIIPHSATCYRCGQRKPMNELKEVALDACLERDDNQNVIEELESENVRLKRALWLARAERAVAEQTVDEWSRYKEKHPFGSWREDPFEYWVQAWIYVEKLCRKKAKEYK